MKYVCKICGYVYDDDKQEVPFEQLPDSWRCPWCGAAKSDFAPQGVSNDTAKAESAAAKKSEREKTAETGEEMQRLSAGELSALCSNLARGCEKQYKQEESELFMQLADYFSAVSLPEKEAEMTDLAKRIQEDLDSRYEKARRVSEEQKDRGAQRVCAWGEKVTLILNALVQRYEREGEAFLADTQIWVCTTCGFVFVGDNPPELCPVCKVPDWKFERVEGRTRS